MTCKKTSLQDQTDSLRRLEDSLTSRYAMFERHKPGDSVWDIWGLECGPGWIPLIIKFADKAVVLDATVRIRQIKEKFNSLRLYCDITPSDGTDDCLHDYIDELELESANQCEVCGEHGCKQQHSAREFIGYCDAAAERLRAH